ncbi:MAG: monovalent cation:proton antiporter-2 (CPA2) family protein [Cyclobacteriaceae bacterium]|nr:monovalent cation:proton antiporter-2 (CPA2) family protein [Cyclobacteriaceae bacterium]
MPSHLLQDILILMSFSVVIVFILQRLKLPSILGFIITGIIIGPYGFGIVNAVEEVEVISEIGVILLLFVIGMELSLRQLASIKKTVFIGGFIQVGITVLVVGVSYYSLGYSWNEAAFVGFLFSLSSTAIVLKVFQDRNEITSPHGRNALAILIFQDIIVVPMMLFTPLIAGQSDNVTLSILQLLLKSAIVIVVTIISARYVMPKLMHAIAKTKSKELFLLTTITICFAVAFLTSEAGLSMALGAFLAGLIISESEYSHQATSVILPFRELFTSFFFISIGMLLDLGFFIENIGLISLIVLGIFILKSSIASLAIAVLKYPPRTILLTGLALFQVGEFAFILSKVGIEYNLLSIEANQYFLAVSIVSMILTPFVIMFSENIYKVFFLSKFVKSLNPKAQLESTQDQKTDEANKTENHLVIIGYGINGSNLAKAAQYSNIPYVVIELNADTVRKEKKKGVPIIFGDATQERILESAFLSTARAVVVAISDPLATKIIIGNIRAVSQSIYLLIRTRYVNETAEILALGADDVIPEEFETSIEIFSRVLHNFLIPENDIEQFVETIRSENYFLLQNQKALPKPFRQIKFPDFYITSFRIKIDSGKLLDKPLKDINLRAEYGINILAISRKEQMLRNIHPDEKLFQGDVLLVNGKYENIKIFRQLLS